MTEYIRRDTRFRRGTETLSYSLTFINGWNKIPEKPSFSSLTFFKKFPISLKTPWAVRHDADTTRVRRGNDTETTRKRHGDDVLMNFLLLYFYFIPLSFQYSKIS